VKQLLFAIGFGIVLFCLSASARAQVPYGYDPYGAYVGVQPDYAYAYDPYYQLHVIHYQLYLQQCPYYYPSYFVPAAPVVVPPAVVVPAAPRVVSRPAPVVRAATPVVRGR